MKMKRLTRLGLGASLILFASITACSAPPTPVILSQPTAVAIAPTAAASPTQPPVAPTNAPTVKTTITPTVALTAEATTAPTAAPTAEPTIAPTNIPTAEPTATPVPAPSLADAGFFGISTNGEVNAKENVRALAILSGARMVRTSVTWQQVEPTPGKFDWRWPDTGFRLLTDNHFEPLVLIMDNAKWGASTKCGPVTDLVAYAQFLRELAARNQNVTYWVLYNEPDNAHGEATSTGGCFGGDDIDGNGKPDYADYAIQLQLAWRALRAGNPNAKLAIGAVAFDNFDEASAPAGYFDGGKGGIFNAKFLDNLFAYMQANPPPPGEKYFDLLSFNYYNLYAPYWEAHYDGQGVIAKANALRQRMRQYGLDAPLLVSETGEDSVTIGNNAQSAFLVKTFTRGASANIARMIWWTFQDFPDSAPPPSNTWKYGLIDQNASPKPSYSAYQTLVQMLGDARFVQALSIGGGEGYLFNKNGVGAAVIWSASAEPITVSFAGNALQITDMFGAARAITDGSPDDQDSAAGSIGLQVDYNPIYVQATN